MKHAKISKKEQLRIDVEREAEWAAFKTLKTEFHDKVFTAKVLWFNILSGKGMILVSGMRLPIYSCNIPGRKTWYPETACVFYDDNQLVEVKLSIFSLNNVMARGVTPGYLDIDKWDRIKEDNLAFRCNEKGEAITGLFQGDSI